jgi:acyl-[acyl-carrier-protein]-phospholipid O-acyltransferase / long-chain-fatty-acid--[acyl-carrier-protein] ligase
LRRFAKIAGETVPLASMEDLVVDLWPDDIAATIAAPDPKRGERVILATTKPGATGAEVQTWMKIKGASEIMRPSSIVILDAAPLLGSGKINYIALAKALRESGGAGDAQLSSRRERITEAYCGPPLADCDAMAGHKT